jgi:hypothetical protein
MATIARSSGKSRTGSALVFLLGVAVFLNYVDRGSISIAAPKMKDELGLSDEAYGLAFSAFFWIYAPVQLFAGWLCDRFSVYRMMAFGILVWAAATLLMGFAGGFASLLVLRIMLGVGESISFPGSSKIIAGRRVDPRPTGLARDLLRLRPGHIILADTLAGNRSSAADGRLSRWRCEGPDWRFVVKMAVVVDVDRPRPRQLVLLFPARVAPAFPDEIAGLRNQRNDLACDPRLRRSGRLRLYLRPFLRLVDSLRAIGGDLPALDDDIDAVARGGRDPRARLRA